MNISRLTTALALAGLLGCSAGTTQPSQSVSIWDTAGIPSGGHILLHLSILDGLISGRAEEFGLQGVPLRNFSLSGRRTGDQFDLTLVPALHFPPLGPSGTAGHFAGSFTGAEVMVGVWNDGVRAPFTETFYLDPAP